VTGLRPARSSSCGPARHWARQLRPLARAQPHLRPIDLFTREIGNVRDVVAIIQMEMPEGRDRRPAGVYRFGIDNQRLKRNSSRRTSGSGFHRAWDRVSKMPLWIADKRFDPREADA